MSRDEASAARAWHPADIPDPVHAAQSMLEAHWDKRLPVDPVAIAKAVGIRVFANTEMGEYSGCFYDADGPIIEYNAFDPLVRQRFTIAHELGHFALHHGARFRDSTENFSLGNYDPLEADANKFAAELLMPTAVVNGAIKTMGITDFEMLAEMFNTSAVAMKFRLKNLGWL
jgi:Zn-dependent peptidase ImmA (M78 family)